MQATGRDGRLQLVPFPAQVSGEVFGQAAFWEAGLGVRFDRSQRNAAIPGAGEGKYLVGLDPREVNPFVFVGSYHMHIGNLPLIPCLLKTF